MQQSHRLSEMSRDPVTGTRCHEVMEVISLQLHWHNLSGPRPILLLPFHLDRYIVETIYVCTALMLQCIMKWHFSSVSVCQEWLWKKCVIAALTTRWHSALRQIPWGLSVPQRTPLPSEEQGEGDKQRKRKINRETCALLCLCLNFKLYRCSPYKHSAGNLA